MKMTIDCYGHELGDERFLQKAESPYMIDTGTSNKVFQRFGTGTSCPIVCISTSGNVITQSWTYGVWDNRTTLTYSKMLCESMYLED